MPHSHHSHSGQFCRHAKSTLREVVLEAIRQGFTTFGLSEHAPRYRLEDLFPEESDLSPVELIKAYDDFLLEASHLKTEFADSITLLIGIESESITPIDSVNLSSLLNNRSEIDYIVGSIHHVCGVSIDFDRSTWLRSVYTASRSTVSTTMISTSSGPRLPPSPDPPILQLESDFIPTQYELVPFLFSYFDAQYNLIIDHQPEVLGHIDLCLLFAPGVSWTSTDLQEIWPMVKKNVKAVVEYGGLFEANAAALRKGWETSYPGREILKLILQLGGRICLSDDSHGVSYVGLNYLRMKDYLVDMGVEEVWYLVPASQRQHDDQTVGRRGRVVARKFKGWAKHPFWDQLSQAQAQPKSVT
ncbi:putative histidinol-phosphatase [Naematelia encephala]|uniref:Histidinol-phosphatase n=1 Tax=Naematelia encephala TaxID=71784 RepID=A0A1Y2B0Y5_9TREE|nr:putative histidinol-phosphatase [Naematelia encephala]